LTQMM
jgi:hypothetical protein